MMTSRYAVACFLALVSLAVACPSKDDIIMQVAACESGINKPQQFTMDTRITFCDRLNWARHCVASVYRSCSAFQLRATNLPQDIRGTEQRLYSEMVVSGCAL